MARLYRDRARHSSWQDGGKETPPGGGERSAEPSRWVFVLKSLRAVAYNRAAHEPRKSALTQMRMVVENIC